MIAPRTPPGPTFDAYCEWLTENGGRVEHKENRWGRFTILHSPEDTLAVMVAEKAVNGMLISEMIEYLDTRLGLASPFGA